MRVIVSSTLKDEFDNYVVIDDCRKVTSLKGVDTLIIHNPNLDGFSLGLFFPNWVNESGIKTFIYINKNPEIKITMLINSVNGKDDLAGSCLSDEFYLEDEEELDALVEEVRNNAKNQPTELAETTGGIIRDFCAKIATGDPSANNPLTLRQVDSAVNELVEMNENQTQIIQAMNQSALDVFDRTSRVLESMDKQSKKIKQQLEELEATQNSSSKINFSSSVVYFPSYKYSGVANVLYIREYSYCRYLTSFILAYRHYLHYSLNKKVKVVIITQKGAIIPKKYDKFSSINQASLSYDSLYENDIITTDTPKTQVLKKIFAHPNDIYIVLDRLYQKDQILQGRIKTLSAVSGKTDLKRYNLNPSNCIFSVDKPVGLDSFYFLPKINGYPEGDEVRFAAYHKCYKEVFSKFDAFLGINNN